MTKICGIVCSEKGFELGRALRAAYDASWQDGYVRREIWEDTTVGLGHMSVGAVNLDPQPIRLADGEDAIVYCGKIFDYHRLKTELVRQGAVCRLADNDAEFLGQFLRRVGPGRLAEINGVFSLAVWNAQTQRLTLVADRYGLRSLYYYHDPVRGVFVFSSDLRGVVDSGVVPRKINWHACSDFLYFGHHLGNETWFCDVHLMPPASVLTFEKNQVRILPYWDLNSISIDEKIDYPTVVDESIRLFTQAMRRQDVPTAGRKVVFLSGGLDSRRIAAEMRRQGTEFETFTTGWDEASADPAVARQVADALGVKNTLVRLPRRNLMMTYWPRCNFLVDYETKLHQWIVPLVERLPGDVKVNYDGSAGDIPFNGVRRDSEFVDLARFQQALAEDAPTLAARLVGRQLNLCVLSGQLRRNLCREHVLESVCAELRKYGDPRNRLMYFYVMNRTRRATALSPLKLLTLKIESFFPFFDNDLFDFVASVPPDMKLTHRLRRDMCRAYPEVSEMPVAVYMDSNGRRNSWQQHPYYRSERRRYYLRLVRRRYLGMNWAFDNFRAGPRVLHDLVQHYTSRRHVSHVFSEAFSTFYEWLARYFPGGAA